MAIPFRADLQQLLAGFIEAHRGVRRGVMFGVPAAYAGRRMFACVLEDGLIIRLPPEVAARELKGRGTRFHGPRALARPGTTPRTSRPGPVGIWVMYRPRRVADARRLTPLLEFAARHVAERQAEDLTGVRRTRK